MTHDKKQDPVSAAIWRWRDPASPPTGSLRTRRWLRAGIQAVIMLVVASWFFFRLRHPVPAGILAALALFVVCSALAWPRGFDAFEKGVGRFAHGVGTAITWILLTPFYYLVFVPGRLILTLRGKDPLRLKFPSNEPTYWVPWKPPPTKEHYAKQYR